MYVVTWRDGLSTITDDGRIVFGKNDDVRAALRKSYLRAVLPDAVEELRPGDEGHIEYALRQLPDAFVTRD